MRHLHFLSRSSAASKTNKPNFWWTAEKLRNDGSLLREDLYRGDCSCAYCRIHPWLINFSPKRGWYRCFFFGLGEMWTLVIPRNVLHLLKLFQCEPAWWTNSGVPLAQTDNAGLFLWCRPKSARLPSEQRKNRLPPIICSRRQYEKILCLPLWIHIVAHEHKTVTNQRYLTRNSRRGLFARPTFFSALAFFCNRDLNIPCHCLYQLGHPS